MKKNLFIQTAVQVIPIILALVVILKGGGGKTAYYVGFGAILLFSLFPKYINLGFEMSRVNVEKLTAAIFVLIILVIYGVIGYTEHTTSIDTIAPIAWNIYLLPLFIVYTYFAVLLGIYTFFKYLIRLLKRG